LLACLPLELRLRGKSTTQSHRSAIYYVDLVVREGSSLEASDIADARRSTPDARRWALIRRRWMKPAKQGFGNAAFEFNEEEMPEIIEEFYPRLWRSLLLQPTEQFTRKKNPS
jgi:hypothetical protein